MPAKVYWTTVAQDDLRSIRSHIAKDAPATASAYVRKLRASVGRLKDMPLSGQIVEELGRDDIREVLQGNYRLIYRIRDNRVDILAVFHSARLLDDSTF